MCFNVKAAHEGLNYLYKREQVSEAGLATENWCICLQLQRWKSKLAGLHWCKSGLFSIGAVSWWPCNCDNASQVSVVSVQGRCMGACRAHGYHSCGGCWGGYPWDSQLSRFSMDSPKISHFCDLKTLICLVWHQISPVPTLFEQWCHLHTSLQAGKPPQASKGLAWSFC